MKKSQNLKTGLNKLSLGRSPEEADRRTVDFSSIQERVL